MPGFQRYGPPKLQDPEQHYHEFKETLLASWGTPTTPVNAARMYAKDVGSVSHMAWLDSDGIEYDLASQNPQSVVTANIDYTKTTAHNVEMNEQSLLRLFLPANTMKMGFTAAISADGLATVNANQPLIDWRLRLGTNSATTGSPLLSNAQVALIDSATTNNQTNVGISLDWVFTVKTTGVTGTCRGQGIYINNINSQLSYAVQFAAETTDVVINTTVDNYLDFSCDWSQQGTGHVISITGGAIIVISYGT